jgi:hypothetical protein
MPAVQRHGGFGAALTLTYADDDLVLLTCTEKQPQCAPGTLFVLSSAEPLAFEEASVVQVRARTHLL